MNVTYNNLSDDWGWFVDIENRQYTHQNKEDNLKIQNTKYYNRLETIEEAEKEQEEEKEDDFNLGNKKKPYDKEINRISKKIFNIGSTTIITVLMTYIVFCLI